MNLSALKRKVYLLVDYIYNRKSISLPNNLSNKKNLFLYFDYEREFGGHKTKITDRHIGELLELLQASNIKATWFTVGKIFEAYPESIEKIQNQGHEIASHTYNHIPPFTSSADKLAKDFKQFSQTGIKVNGFHSPRGEWNHHLIHQLKINHYAYDVIGLTKDNKTGVIQLSGKKEQQVLRLTTLGDDWPLYKSNYSKEEVKDYFCSMVEILEKGQLAGIGFHPWVLFSDPEIFKGFKMFIAELSQSEAYNLAPAISFIDKITNG